MATNKPFEFFIQWHVTENCNLLCKHCYQGERSHEELPFSLIKRTVAEASDMIAEWSDRYEITFNPSMNITGGEPFLRKDLVDILRAVKQKGFEVYLLTNGTLVDDERAKMLADLGVDGVQVSVEGAEEVHDAIRGAGSYAAATAGVERLVDADLDVTLNVTLSTMNVEQVRKVITYGSHVGVRRIGFSRLVPSGKGRALMTHMLSRDDLKGLYRSLLSLELHSLKVVTGDPVAAQISMPLNGDAGAVAMSGCAAGVSGLTIQQNGNVMPCRRLPLSLGNVTKHSLRKIWASSPVLEALRDRSRYKGKCGTCARWAHCRGCRAIAYAVSRARGEDDFLADDPQCFIESGIN